MLGTGQARTAGETVPCRKYPEDRAESAKSTHRGRVGGGHSIGEVSHSFRKTRVSDTKTGLYMALSDTLA